MAISDSFAADDIGSWMNELKDLLNNGDFQPAFEEAVAILNDGVYQNFTSAVGPDGASWPEHAPSTVARYGPHPLLVLSGAMIAAATDRGAAGHEEEYGPREASVGLSTDTIPYAAVHQFGFAARNIPPRPYWYTVDDVDERAAEVFFDWAWEIVVGS